MRGGSLVRRAWLLYLACSLTVSAWAALGGAPEAVYPAVAFASAGAVLLGGWLWRPAGRLRWTLFALGLGSWASADLTWQLLDDAGAVPFPSAADGLYLVGYLLLVVAVGGVAALEVRDRESAIDAAVVAAGAAGLIAGKVFEAANAAGGSWLAKGVALSYPTLSLVLLGAGARLWLSARSRRMAVGLLALAFVFQLVADACYAVESVAGTYFGGVVDLGWLCAYSLLGAASLHPSASTRPRKRNAESISLSLGRLSLLAAAAFAPLLGHAWFGLPIAAALITTLALAIVCVVRVAQPIEKMRRAATIDELTGLANRLAALDRLEHLLDEHAQVAVLHCDIARLKLVNDALGHDHGDAVIVAVGDRLAGAAPARGLVARLTGDELVVIVPSLEDADALALAEQLQQTVQAPVKLGEIELNPTLAVGIAIAKRGCDPADVLRRADAAVALAKTNAMGSGAIALEDSDDAAAYRRLCLARDLRDALRHRGITVAFQPEFLTASGSLFGFEALARWHHPDLGPIPPDVFVPMAEEVGLVNELLACVLDQALDAQHGWRAAHGVDVPVSVNVSPLQLGPSLIDVVRGALERWRPADGLVWLELTETAVAAEDTVVDVLTQLRQLGVRLAIDDFGTGHSSLSRLAAVEWDAIKIDRSFVGQLRSGGHARTIAAATIAMAASLDVLTIAEGVETDDQRAALRELGCDVLQGFLLSRPLSRVDAGDVVRRQCETTVPDAVTEDSSAREVSALVLHALVSYAGLAAGPDAAAAVASAAGLTALEDIDPTAWCASPTVAAAAKVAAAACGDPAIGRRVGEEQVRLFREDGLDDLLLGLGSVEAAMAQVLQVGMRMAADGSFEITDQAEGRLEIRSVTSKESPREQFWCDYLHGIFVSIPAPFGVEARVIEPECEVRGDPACRFVLTWSGRSTADPDDESSRFEERVATVEHIQAIAADLLDSHELHDVLERICDQTAKSLQAPRFLVAVRTGAADALRVVHRGFDSDHAARRRAAELLAGQVAFDGESAAVARIGAEPVDGVLAAFGSAAATFAPWEQRVLDAYARHASSILAIVDALDGAKRDRDTSTALLTLASELAGVRTSAEVARHLVRVAPSIVGSDVATLWHYDATTATLRLQSWHDVDGRVWRGADSFGVRERPEIEILATSPQPFLLRSGDVDSELQILFDSFDATVAAAVPVVAHGELLGILTAGFRAEPDDDDVPQLMATLRGLADHAATAMENGRLLDEVRHQALHDPLTELPNRRLVERRARELVADRATSVAVLFVDLDLFKSVNDEYGHGAGDDLLCQVARRLESAVRASDTVGRISGDEFLILLPDADHDIAGEIARRIVDVLRSPFRLGDVEVAISCSVGVALGAFPADSYDGLVRRADAAMYRAKTSDTAAIAV